VEARDYEIDGSSTVLGNASPKQTVTNDNGEYLIYYSASQLVGNKNLADLKIHAYNINPPATPLDPVPDDTLDSNLGTPVVSSELIVDAEEHEVVNLIISTGSYIGETDYTSTEKRIRAFLDLDDISKILTATGNSDSLKAISQKSGLEAFKIRSFLNSRVFHHFLTRADRPNSKPPLVSPSGSYDLKKVLYGIIQGSDPKDVKSILGMKKGQRAVLLREAIESNLIDIDDSEDTDTIIEAINSDFDNAVPKMGLVDIFTDENGNIIEEKTPIAELISQTGIDDDTQENFYTFYSANIENITESFWDKAETDGVIDAAQKEDLKRIFLYYTISRNHVPMARILYLHPDNPDLDDIGDLADLTETDIISLIDSDQNSYLGGETTGRMVGVPGVNDPTEVDKLKYAQSIESTIDNLLSSRRIKAQLEAQSTPTQMEELINRFLDANTGGDPSDDFSFELSVRTYLKNTPSALDSFTAVEKQSVLEALYIYKSLFGLLDHREKTSQIKFLLDNNFRSATDIKEIGEEAFVARINSELKQYIPMPEYAKKFGEGLIKLSSSEKYDSDLISRVNEALKEKTFQQLYAEFQSDGTHLAILDELEYKVVSSYSKAIYRRAKAISGKALAIQPLLSPQLNSDSLGIISNGAPTSKNDQEIQDNPELEVLFGSQDFCECKHCQSSTSPFAYLVDIFKFIKNAQDDESLNLWDTLNQRRPDLIKLSSSCENTNTVFPYIDLVNEVLEAAITKTGFERQTTLSSDALRVYPEHIQEPVYDTTLNSTTYPWSLPYNLANREADVYLNEVKVDRQKILRVISGKEDQFLGFDIETAKAELGMSSLLHSVFSDTAYTKFYGGISSYLDLQSVQELLDKSGITYEHLSKLIKSKYINPLNKTIEFAIVDGVESCKVADASLLFDVEEYRKLHWFERLRNHLGWTVEELDIVISALGSNSINDLFFERLAGVKSILSRFPKLGLKELLTWYGFMSDDTYENSKSYFEEVFLNPKSIQRQTVLDAISNADTTPIQLVNSGDLNDNLDSVSAILAVLRINAKELTELALEEGITGDVWKSQLIHLYGVVSYCNHLDISISEYLDWKRLLPNTGGPVGSKPNDTIEFLEKIKEIQSASISLQDLKYWLENEYSGEYGGYGSKPNEILTSVRIMLQEILVGKGLSTDKTAEGLEALFGLFFPQDLASSFIELVKTGEASIPTRDPNKYDSSAYPDSKDAKIVDTDLIGRYWKEFIGATATSQLESDLNKDTGLAKSTNEELQIRYNKVFKAFYPAVASILDFKGKCSALIADLLDTSQDVTDILAGEYLVRSDKNLLLRLTSDALVYSGDDENSLFPNELEDLDFLLKQVSFITKLGIQTDEFELLFTRSAITHLFDLKNSFPVRSISVPVSDDFLSLIQILRYNKIYSNGDFSLLNLVKRASDSSPISLSEFHTDLVTNLNWSQQDIDYLIASTRFGLTEISDYQGVRWLSLLAPVFELIQKTGVTAAKLESWSAQDLILDTSKEIMGSVKSKFSNKVWDDKGAEIRDILRREQRDALSDYLISTNPKFKNTNDLYANYLLDTEMEPCFMISRSKLAISTIQLWVQRIRMNLEPGLSFSAKDIPEWEWRKNYRVWEAARKVFYYPENFLEPELRDNRSNFFNEMLDELLQNEVTKEAVESAYKTYLEKLHKVSHLEIMATYVDEDTKTQHFFGRTKNLPHKYYHQQWVKQIDWTSWEPIDVEIEGNHIIPVLKNGRLLLFWAILETKADPSQSVNSVSRTGSEGIKGQTPEWITEVSLGYTEKLDGKWSAKSIVREASGEKMFYKSGGHSNHSRYFLNYDDSRGGIEIKVQYLHDDHSTEIGSIYANHGLTEFDFRPVGKQERKDITSVDDVYMSNQRLASGPISILEEDGTKTSQLLNADGTYSITHNIIDSSELTNSNQPFVVADSDRTFLVQKAKKPVKIRNVVGQVKFTSFTFDSHDISAKPARDKIDEIMEELIMKNIKEDLRVNAMFNDYTLNPTDFLDRRLFVRAMIARNIESINSESSKLSRQEQNSILSYRNTTNNTKTVTHTTTKRVPKFKPIWGWRNKITIKTLSIDAVELPSNRGERERVVLRYEPDGYTITTKTSTKTVETEEYEDKEREKLQELINSKNSILSKLNSLPLDSSQLDFKQLVKAAFYDSFRIESSQTGGEKNTYDVYGSIEYSQYRILPYYHFYTGEMISQINQNGLDGILKPEKFDSSKFLVKQQGRDVSYNFKSLYEPNDQLVYSRNNVPVYPDEGFDFASQAPYNIYNWELFYHGPMLLAEKLSQDQKFEEAQKWYHVIFDPTEVEGNAPKRYWKFKPFHEYMREFDIAGIIRKMGEDDEFENQIEQWTDNPFMPHRIARLRTAAYMKSTVMKYLDNLIAWGDYLFTRDTIESLNEATQIYILASDILGEKPIRVTKKDTSSPQLLEDFLTDNVTYGSNPLVRIEAEIELLETRSEDKLKESKDNFNALNSSLAFCIAPNDKLLGYWDILADRLFKIRNCLNIEGVFRTLPLFQPPIDPALLVKADAAGISIGAVLDGLSGVASPHYRFRVLIQKAIELCNDVKGLGQGLLSVLEKKDSEEMSLLRASQEVNLLNATKEIKKQAIKESEESLASLKDSKSLAEKRKEYYSSREYMNHQEKQQLKKMDNAMKLQLASQVTSLIGAALASIPDFEAGIAGAFGSPFVTVKAGGSSAFNSMTAASQVLQALSSIQSHKASVAGIKGGYDRRRDDWEFQAEQASMEIPQIEKQITAAEIRLAMTERELENHDIQIKQSEEAESFMKSKFTNRELYNWMITQTSKLYFQSYQLAVDVARMAERAYARELGVNNPAFVQYGHWDSMRKGLLAGERLQADLRRMEIAYLEQNKREYEITKNIPLSMLSPIQLEQLRTTGTADFHIPEVMFDLDFPGQYKRRIKSVRVTIPGVTGNYTNVSAKLTLLSSGIRINTDLEDSAYATDNLYNDDRFRMDVGGIQSIATSTGQNDSGLFELNFNDERYLPFEGSGAISNWRLELPNKYKAFDYNSIADVIIQVSYTAKDGGQTFKNTVEQEIADTLNKYADWLSANDENLSQGYSLKTHFPNALHDLLNQEIGTDRSTQVILSDEHIPYFLVDKDLELTYAVAMIKTKGDAVYTDMKLDILNESSNSITSATNDNSIQSAVSSPYPLDYMEGDFPNGSDLKQTWTLSLQDPQGLFTSDKIEDVILLTTFSVS
ncbi:Tc toxin subunit A-related protein, partial [Reichenbachiella versicolor]|uniref:Tc toxin subunit A-related protein n=1 Tax=Reichenbachiella versicolor TaxID=1821036 RepID=UPI001C86986C